MTFNLFCDDDETPDCSDYSDYSAAATRYINLDDWYATRTETTGVITGAMNFPSGMRAPSDFVHAQVGVRFFFFCFFPTSSTLR